MGLNPVVIPAKAGILLYFNGEIPAKPE